MAIRKNWSLNSCVEEILLDAVYHEPNTETVEAIEEAKAGKSAGKLDVSSYDAFMNSINAIE
jgi:antitoxin component of RelBE/YafQ-DinJ toxin-antitoxin module